MGVLINYPKFKADTDAGAPLTGGFLYSYIAGTTTAKATYTTRAMATANANPVVLDSRGEATIYGGGLYKLVLTTSAGVVIWTQDNVELGPGQGAYSFFVNASETNQSIAGSGATLYDILVAIGTSKKATVYLPHSGVADTTTYTFSTSFDASAYANINFVVENGAILTLATGVTLTLADPGNVQVQPTQQWISLTGTGQVVFSKPGTVYPDWFGSRTTQTTVQAAVDAVPVGGRIGLLGKYTTNPVTLTIPTDYTGDACKQIIGMVCSAPRLEGTTEMGAELYLASDAGDSPVLSIVGTTSQRRAAVKLDNFRIYGNRGRGGTITSSHGLFLSYIKDCIIGSLIIEECGGDGFHAGTGDANQVFADYLELFNNDGKGFNGGSLADSHIDKLIAYLNKGIGVSIVSTVQVSQIHSYYNGMSLAFGTVGNVGYQSSGVSLSGNGSQIGSIRSTHNDGIGVAISSGPNYIGNIRTKNNGKNVSSGVGGLTYGVRFSGTDGGNIIGSVVALDSEVAPTQTYGVFYLTNAPSNKVMQYYGSGNATGDVYFTSGSGIVGCLFPQKPTQSVTFASLNTTPVVPASGRVVVVSDVVTASVNVVNTADTQSCDGQELIFVATKDANATPRVLTFGTEYIANTTNTLTLTNTGEKVSIHFVRSGGYWREIGRQTGM